MTQPTTAPGPAALGFDPDALRAKYREERDRRLRAEGNEQYRNVTGAFGHYLDDPYVQSGFSRAPRVDDVAVVVIGGGFGGLLAGARLREAGIEDVRLIEKGGDFGGTWYWNRYPGAQCDVESYIYLPLLEELGYVPKEKYSRGPEIFAHCKAIAEKFDLYRDVCLQTQVTEIRWDKSIARKRAIGEPWRSATRMCGQSVESRTPTASGTRSPRVAPRATRRRGSRIRLQTRVCSSTPRPCS